MKPKSYPQNKREIISKRPTEDIIAFCKEINTTALRKITIKLPPVNGFRKGTDLEIRERLKVYIRKIGHWTNSDWGMFLDLWLAWIDSHRELNELLKQFDNDEDFSKDTVVPPNSQKDVECFEYLTLYGEEARISRGLIKTFYDYGYFEEDSKIEYYVSQAKSELEFKMLDTFREVDIIRDLLKQSNKNNEDLENRFIKQLENFGDKVGMINSRIDQIDNIFSTNKHNLNKQLQTLNQKLSELLNEINTLKKHSSELESKFNTVTSDVIQLQKLQSENKEAVIGQFPTNPILYERVAQTTTYSHFESLNLLNKALVNNFKAIGMTSIEAKRFSKELLAAILSQATITFKGQLASMIANICARTISVNSTSVCYIPIGLLDQVSFTKLFDDFTQESLENDTITTLIIEGVNNSPFEGFAARLSQYISKQAIWGKNHESIIICTLSSDAVLECPLVLGDSGPVFDTDCFEWRKRWDIKELDVGVVSKETFNGWVNMALPIPEIWDDLYEEYGCLGGVPSILRDRFLLKAVKHLSEEDGNPLIQSLAFAWLIPRGMMLGTDFTKYKHLIAEGKFDASEPDKRTIRLLSDYKVGD